MAIHAIRGHRAVALVDHLYRAWHRLDAPAAKVPPLLTVSRERAWRRRRLPDGTVLRPGDRYGELHLDNARVVELRAAAASSVQLGLAFRRELYASLATLAWLADGGGRYRDVVAFSAITIFHHGLTRLGFEVEPGALLAPRITGAYQHALLLTLAARPGARRAP
ncbi:MAG TPA: hypothetical protein VNN07_10800, partial [Candidatus Tectomicrobia bacterium]|nr:hypothetical protein [Candidatus Tectomicrobia bacterium]